MNLVMKSSAMVMALVLVLTAGCAHTGSNSEDMVGPNGERLPPPTAGSVKEVGAFRLSDPEPPAVADDELDAIPVDINERVEQWIRYFQGRGRPHMERYLSRSSRYSTLMKRILRENGLPEDLIYIALIESGFNQKATSHAAAVGYWQFIRGTGKRYGLEINSLVDERRDPVLSTQAAAEYFKGLYSIFGSWYLAMASYNVGENRVKRETFKHKTLDFWELAHKKRLPKETMNYVPKFIAAKLIGKNPAKYGFIDIDYQQPIEFELVKLEHPVNLRIMAEKMGLDYEDFKQINPKFRGEIAPTKENGVLELRVPLGQTSVAQNAAPLSMVDKVEFIADAGETKTYRVRRGDSLSTIARANRTTVGWLREVNDLGPRKKLRIGQRLQVPDRTRKASAKRVIVAKKDPVVKAPVVPEAVVAQTEQQEDKEAAAQDPEIVTAQGVYYIVQPGDSLYSIAREYDSTISELLKMNKMKRGRVLKVGAKILVPKDEKLPEDPSGEPKLESKDEENASEDEARSSLDANSAKVRPAAVVQRAPASLNVPKVAAQPARRAPASQDSSRVHVVKRGENLFRIAKMYGVSMRSIQDQNNLRSPSEIGVGKRLRIPQ